MKTFKALLETEIERKSTRHSFIEVLTEEIELIRKARNLRVSHSKIASYLKEAWQRVSASEVRQFCVERGLEPEVEVSAKPVAKKRRKKKSVKPKVSARVTAATQRQTPEQKVADADRRPSQAAGPRAGFRTPIGDDL